MLSWGSAIIIKIQIGQGLVFGTLRKTILPKAFTIVLSNLESMYPDSTSMIHVVANFLKSTYWIKLNLDSYDPDMVLDYLIFIRLGMVLGFFSALPYPIECSAQNAMDAAASIS